MSNTPTRENGSCLKVKYGKDETLLCNPSCAVINLLSSIKRRTGYGNNSICLDLSDVTGLVKDLDVHKTDYATKHLQTHTTYILVEKQVQLIHENDGHEDDSPTPSIQYVPLLDNYSELFPEFRVHVSNKVEKKKKRQPSKSPSPAGIRGVKAAKTKIAAQRSNSKKSVKS